MKATTLKNLSLPIDELFAKIFDNPEIEEYLREKASKELRIKINTAKHNRYSMKSAAKEQFIKDCGIFKEVQVSLWRLK